VLFVGWTGARPTMTCACSTGTAGSWPLAGSRMAWQGWGSCLGWWPPMPSGPGEVAVGVETDRGLLVGALVAAGYQVYAVNPQVVGRYRGRHQVSRAKSDRGDAKVLADLVRTDRHNHRQVAGDSLLAEAVKVLARAHQSLIWARQRHVNALRSALREFYPGRWPPSAPSWLSPRPLACWSWRRPLSKVGGSPEQRCGGRSFRPADGATSRRGWWPFMMRWRRRSWPRPSPSRPPTARS